MLMDEEKDKIITEMKDLIVTERTKNEYDRKT